jgi:citrate lyase subunit beta / citryl-CoA lyase
MYRSMLYVPASNDKFVARAAERGADAIILDLEDSIAPSDKEVARDALMHAVPECARNGADVLVRVNRPIRACIRDIEAAVAAGADGILLPKADSAGHVCLIAEAIEDIERAEGIETPAQLYVILEHPAAVLQAKDIISAHPRVAGASAGGEDLATALDAEAVPDALRMPKLLVHLAAKAAGRYSFGLMGSVADYTDQGTIRDLVREARRHGFDGASCIHPSVVPLLNEGFAPEETQLAEARRIVEAFDAAVSDGRGAISVDGKMVDIPVAVRARRLIARARRT